jgi:hypothetical protein
MVTIGVDYHPSSRAIAFCVVETGEQQLSHGQTSREVLPGAEGARSEQAIDSTSPTIWAVLVYNPPAYLVLTEQQIQLAVQFSDASYDYPKLTFDRSLCELRRNGSHRETDFEDIAITREFGAFTKCRSDHFGRPHH